MITESLTNHPDEHITGVEELTVTDINDSELSANFKVTKYVDGHVVYSDEHVFCYAKTTTDFRTAIVGTCSHWDRYLGQQRGLTCLCQIGMDASILTKDA